VNLSSRIVAIASRVAFVASLVGLGTAAAQTENGFDFGGTQRTRYETLDPQFRAGFSDSDQAVALQTTLVFNWRHDAWLVGGELMDSRSYANDTGSFANGTTTNALEPLQAYVAWRHDASTFRVGRVTQDLGKRRFVARNRYRNTVNNFTGVDWSWTGAEGRAARAFYWVPMRLLPADQASVLDNEFDRTSELRRLLRTHELGHALGYNHVKSRVSIMNPRIGPELTDFDRQVVMLAFRRPDFRSIE